MLKVSRWATTSAILIALLALSLYGCYFFIRMPLTRSRNNVDLRYTQSVEYGYMAFVEPSLLYDNRTEISEGEPLYINLVERLEIIFQYELKQNPSPVEMTDIKLRYEASGALSGGDWEKTYPLELTRTGIYSFAENYTLDVEEIEGIVDTIGEEIGTRAYAYTYEIRPRISLEASAGREAIEQEFTPTLKIKFEGGKIEFEGLTNTRTGSVTHRETEVATWRLLGWNAEVPAMRAASIIASLSLAAALFPSVMFILQERASRTFMERLSGDIRDRIIEASEPPERIEKATISVGSLEDLAKVAEEAFKPIIHYGEVFYVLDGDVRYEFRVKTEADEI